MGTTHILDAIVDLCPDCHLVHLGTMGVYGYDDSLGKIPDGYLNVKRCENGEVIGRSKKILYPQNPGSIYHATKCLDQILFAFYARNWGVKITDLHQGIVWGVQTELTESDPVLSNRFDYDGIYGTVLNRFLVEAALGHPLTIYGSGGQERAFIHISDTTLCVKLAVENGEFDGAQGVRIFNQVAEVFSVMNLAHLVGKKFGVPSEYLANPRKELLANKLYVDNEGLKGLGFRPKLLEEEELVRVFSLVSENVGNINQSNILNSPKW